MQNLPMEIKTIFEPSYKDNKFCCKVEHFEIFLTFGVPKWSFDHFQIDISLAPRI